MKIATCTQCGWTGDASLCDNGDFEPPSCAMCERAVMVSPAPVYKCDLCDKEFDYEPLPVVDENYNVQKGLISCGCHIYTEED